MAKHIFAYAGHQIGIETHPGDVRMAWEIQIDGEKPVVLRTSSACDEVDAQAEARSTAINIIELRKGLA